MFINEADGLFQYRMSVDDDNKNKVLALDQNTLQNLILDKLENFEGIMIGTSNMVCNMDKVFERRILYKVNFQKIEKDVAKKIWKDKMPNIKEEYIEKLLEKYYFNGGNIENISKKLLIDEIVFGREIGYDGLCKECEKEIFGKKEIKIGFGMN